MVAFNGQLEVTMTLRGPGMTVVESELEAVAAYLRPSVAIFDGQLEVAIFAGTKHDCL